MTDLTIEQVAVALPATLKNSVTQDLVDKINGIAADPLMAEQIRDNFISYTAILKDGKFKTEDYLSAVTYISYKLMGNTNKEAWSKTFPHRHAALMAKGAAEKDIAAHVTAYNKGKLVNLILEQTLVPTWVLNADIYQKAINTQYMLMTDEEVSPKVRSDAANSILTHLKKPEGKDFQISIETKDNSGLNELKDAMSKMAEQQRDMIANGYGIKRVASATIIENEPNGID